MEPWLIDQGYHITRTLFYDNPAMPAPQDIDLLIIMGGPMSVNDEEAFPWLADEKWAITQYMKRNIPIVGVCLGAQLIAASNGVQIYPGPDREIGWLPIESCQDDLFMFPSNLSVFHWHGETFDLPEGAVRLASSAGCMNQAFRMGENTIGLQFHLETTPESAKALVENCRDEITSGKYIQDEAAILSAGAEMYESINRQMMRVLEFVTRNIR